MTTTELTYRIRHGANRPTGRFGSLEAAKSAALQAARDYRVHAEATGAGHIRRPGISVVDEGWYPVWEVPREEI